jgi:hypothetical protein
VPDEGRAGVPGPGDDVDHAGRQVGLLAHLGEQQRRQRGGLGRLEHDRVPARQRRGDLPREHQQREVPGDDLPAHPERARVEPEPGPVELVGPAGVVEEVRRRGRHVDVAGLADRLAVVDGLEHGELAGPLLQDPCDPEQVLAALGAGQLRPRPERLACRLHGPVHVLVVGDGDVGEVLLGGGRDGRHVATVGGVDEVAADEQPVGVTDGGEVAGLGRRCVVPGRGDQVGDRLGGGHHGSSVGRLALGAQIRRLVLGALVNRS